MGRNNNRYDRRNDSDSNSFGKLLIFGVVLGAGIYLVTREQNRRAIDAKLSELGLKDAAEDLGNSVSKGWEQTKQAAQDAGSTIASQVAEVGDTAAHAAKDVADTARDNQGTVQQAGQQLKSDAQDAASKVQDKAAGAVDQLKDKAEDAKDAAQQKAGEVKQDVQQAGEQLKDKAEDAKDAAQQKAGEVKQDLQKDSGKGTQSGAWPYTNNTAASQKGSSNDTESIIDTGANPSSGKPSERKF
ncbi:hypothetical protein [Deinococcus sp. Marseille-Q6407]|uniref:hypothetical protein n=1 Tax=Deinococcus sp. Marseille-Q6407 TaxID=2969223 RepID=UPI0021BDFFF3|nr:hypothetical protein [Deinococcus sp. Marseille-Q6407]